MCRNCTFLLLEMSVCAFWFPLWLLEPLGLNLLPADTGWETHSDTCAVISMVPLQTKHLSFVTLVIVLKLDSQVPSNGCSFFCHVDFQGIFSCVMTSQTGMKFNIV